MGSKACRFSASKGLAATAVVVVFAINVWAANTEKVVHSFTGGNDGIDPAATLAQDAAGNFYGTTVSGGTGTLCKNGCGTVFELSPIAGGKWKEKVLYSFTGGSDGKNPYGGVTLDSKGDLYGTTVSGGSGGACSGDGCGVVFLLSKSGKRWVETVMYNFTGGKDGSGPGGAVVFDSVGNLYGTTPDGGNLHKCNGLGCGVVYQISPVRGGGWKQTVLHTFTGGADGAVGSLGPLLVDKAGNVFGVAELGGDPSCQCGTVFRLRTVSGKWKFKTLDAFKGAPQAGFPYGGVIADSKGNLYGSTYYGGANGAGSVFKLTKSAGEFMESVLYSFTGGSDGGSPTTTLIFDAKANLYGTTSAGGDSNGDGVVFKLTPKSGGKWSESVVHHFGKKGDGANPYYGLVRNKAGVLFGTTAIGGGSGEGVVFQIAP
ncbi:MAG: choice-of-anchor tandem repeat GloVer-containing protein [Terriglobales bacterium]